VDLSRIEWRKASYSANGRGQCVEVGAISRGALVRDSKDPDGPKLAFTVAEWKAFTRRVKAGGFNLP
jgi:hypothetical protein